MPSPRSRVSALVALPLVALPLALALLATTAVADILWDTCEGEADFPSVKEGNYYNLCIQEHEFTDQRHAWTLTKTSLSDTVFDSCYFDNTREKSNNFTEATWTNVEFKSCRFASFTEEPIVFDSTAMNNVVFKDCIFHSSADLIFRKFLFNNVTFDNCRFEGDTLFELGEANELTFLSTGFKRSATATTPSGTDSLTMRQVTVRGLLVKKSQFINPLRLEGVSAADVSFNDTSVNKMFCHSAPEQPVRDNNPRIEYLSAFNDSAFQTVTFNDAVDCDRTRWLGFFMGNVTFHNDADFSYSNMLDLYWDEVEMKSPDGACHTLDMSHSTITRRVLANTTIACKALFDQTTFETVFVKNFYGKRPSFKGAQFIEQEFIDSHCCTRACRPLKCKCNVSEPSGECPVGRSDVNVRASDSCFPADATVRRHDGLVVRMQDLAIAENIAVGAGQHSDVFFFGHRSEFDETEFVVIRHASASRPLRISPDHYLYVNGALRTSRMVRPGDHLRDADGNDELFVTEVSRESGRGLYAPTSLHGDLLVDGVVVSSYTSALHPSLAHKMLHPLRLLYRSGLDSIVSRFTLLHERSWSGVSQALGIPRGPDVVVDKE